MIRDELTKKKEEFLELCSTIGISESTIKKSNHKIDIKLIQKSSTVC